MKAFFTKKQKKLMRERRKKKRLYEKQAVAESGDGRQDGAQDGETSSSRKRPHDALSTPQTPGGNSNNSNNNRIILPEGLSSKTPQTPGGNSSNSNNRIILPEGLSSKEAKKFRKDARRQARTEGRDESKLVFVSSSAENDDKDNNNKQTSNKRRKGSSQHSFPNLNELAQEQERQKERQEAEEARLQAERELPDDVKQRYVALDCEMVGVGSSGKQSALARVSVTDWNGTVLMDSFVQVPTKVTDFRTRYSGVLPKHIQSRKAITVEDCRQRVTDLLRDKILVGHALKNDLQALMLTHPVSDTRDTAKYRPYQRAGGDGKYRPRKLRDLVAQHCDMTIQAPGESHDSVDDARAAMELFKASRVAWEAALARKQPQRRKQGYPTKKSN